MTDYTIFYKKTLPIKESWSKENSWDLFISAYNSSERVKIVYDKVVSQDKHWLLLPDYGYKESEPEYPTNKVYSSSKSNESEFIQTYLSEFVGEGLSDQRICVDITGFIKSPQWGYQQILLVNQILDR